MLMLAAGYTGRTIIIMYIDLSAPGLNLYLRTQNKMYAMYVTHSLLAFTLVLHHVHFVVFLKPTVSIRPSVPSSVPPSGSHN